ncbi:aldehyde dehydrogenase family protein [Mesorhizobium opportunistum]|uniref:aldehyde dehydrogenase family protein n=1 Tax=Mesorhizobium opportunistum TaxID=593909 RepID=UPI003336EC18
MPYDRAVDIAMDAKFVSSGQDCPAANQIYVQRGLYSGFCNAYAMRREAEVRPRLDEASRIGLLMHERAVGHELAHGTSIGTGPSAEILRDFPKWHSFLRTSGVRMRKS